MYGWDYENRMTSIAGAATATYKYDYQGRRTSKTVGGVTTTYLYDGLSIVSEWSTATIHYLHGPGIDEPLARVGGGAPVVYFTADGLGSISTAADAGGVMQNSYTYDAWGVTRSSSENVPQSFRYTAREVADLPDRMFYRARLYNAPVGRFLSEDPLRYSEDGNFYPYVRNAPVVHTDPSGLQLYKPGPAPSDAPPPGCTATPWTFAGDRTKKIGSKGRWILINAQEIFLPVLVGGNLLSTGMCECIYELGGSVGMYERWEIFKRTVYCENCRSYPDIRRRNPVRTTVPEPSVFSTAVRLRKRVPAKAMGCTSCPPEVLQ